MRSLHQQKGVTAIGWMTILALIGFFVLLTLRMLPSYMEYFKVVSTLESLEKEPGFHSPGEIKNTAEKRFNINYVSVISRKDLTVKASSGSFYLVRAKYESRVHLFANVSVVMSFDKQAKVKRL